MRETFLKISFIVILILFISSSVEADHNANMPGYSPNRGYNQYSCESMTSKNTGVQGEWLGHYIGCLIEEEGTDYVLIMEYEVRKLTMDGVKELRRLSKEHDTEEPAPGNWIPI